MKLPALPALLRPTLFAATAVVTLIVAYRHCADSRCIERAPKNYDAPWSETVCVRYAP